MEHKNQDLIDVLLLYFKSNYKAYLKLIIAMELGGRNADFFKLTRQQQESLIYEYITSDRTIFDTETLDDYFGENNMFMNTDEEEYLNEKD